MADSLRRLANLGYFTLLQSKLENWLEEYKINTTSQNVERCCDIIELNTRVQAQLFRLLNFTSAEAGIYTSNLIKSRLLPWHGNGLFPSSTYYPYDKTLDLIAENVAKEREITDMQDMYERSITTLDADLDDIKVEADTLRAELDAAQEELEDTKRQSESEKMMLDSENRELRVKLNIAEDEIASLRGRTSLVDNYERQLRALREDIAILSGRKEAMLRSELDLSMPLLRVTSPLSLDDVTQRVRQSNLVVQFNDMYARDRLDAMDILRRYSDDHENNQRIIFAIMQEAFFASKASFARFKLKVRSNLALTHKGPETLEEAVQDYINRNSDLIDLPGLVADVLRALNRNTGLDLPPEASYAVLSTFIRQACRFAWACCSLAHPLDISFTSDGELYDDAKYRRSYDSEFSAPLVNHHIWPALVQGLKIMVKGEACTRRGAFINSRGRSRSRSVSPTRARSPSAKKALSPTRSYSPSRPLSPSRSFSPSRALSRARSRSPSPIRKGRISPGESSRTSDSQSRARTMSTRLSHYGVMS